MIETPTKDNLFQEQIDGDPWKMLVGCILLNKSSGTNLADAFNDIMARWPTPSLLGRAGFYLERVIKPMGLQNNKACALRMMSQEYMSGSWKDPLELYGVGEYARQSWSIFIEGVAPSKITDDSLRAYVVRQKRRGLRPHKKYAEWMKSHKSDHCFKSYVRK